VSHDGGTPQQHQQPSSIQQHRSIQQHQQFSSTVHNRPQMNSTESHMFETEALVRTQQCARLGEAEALRRGHYLALARRKSRRAERAALQARLVLARSL